MPICSSAEMLIDHRCYDVAPLSWNYRQRDAPGLCWATTPQHQPVCSSHCPEHCQRKHCHIKHSVDKSGVLQRPYTRFGFAQVIHLLFRCLHFMPLRTCFSTSDFFNAFISSHLHGGQPWHREDCCASNSRQGRWACAHAGSGPLPPCNSPSIPVSPPTPKYDACEKHCSNPDCPTHPWPCYCPLHHSSSWKP